MEYSEHTLDGICCDPTVSFTGMMVLNFSKLPYDQSCLQVGEYIYIYSI